MTKNKSILIVDDDVDLSDVLRELLIFEDFIVQTAGNGKEALELLANSETPGVILTDILMPVMDGHEFIKFLRSNPATASIPVVVLSGLLDISSIKGANAFLAKPFVMSPLLALVKTYCR